MLCARAWMCRMAFRGTSTHIRPVSSMFDLIAELPKEPENEVKEGLRRSTISSSSSKRKTFEKAFDGIVKLQVMCNGAAGGSHSVIVSAGGSMYFFNCGEGTQRLCREAKLKFRKLSTVFFTSPRWENIGGFLGLALSAQMLEMPQLHLKGHENIPRLQQLTRNFINLASIKLQRDEATEFSDGTMNIRSVIINRNQDAAADDLWRSSHNGSNDFVVAYICKPENRKMSLWLNRCVELGVPPGPHFQKLKAGEEVTLDDGRVIKPSDVVKADYREIFIILECPSQAYVDGFLTAQEFTAHQADVNVADEDMAKVVVHMTPKEVFESAKYQMFLKKFHPDTVHLQLGEENNHEQNAESFRKQCALHIIHPELFPLLPRSKRAGVPAFLTYAFLVNPVLERSPVNIEPEMFVEEAKAAPGFMDLVAQFKEQLGTLKVKNGRSYPLVTFLGTGSSVPSKERNVSGILIATQPDAYILFDCGESSWSQIIHHFGVEGANNVLRNLRCIYVSHMHADHHLGIITMLKQRRKLGMHNNLLILGPAELAVWLQKFSNVFEEITFDFLHNGVLREGDSSKKHAQMFNKLSVDRIATCYVPHCNDSFGVRLDVDGYSVVYSGDTKAAPSLVKLGQGCDLLIHEATEETGREREALFKAHSTTAQAIEAGRLMNAKFTLLTHFSQRYCKLPYIEERAFKDGRVGCAFDHMEVSPKHLNVLPHIYPILKSLFWENYESLNKKSETQSYRRQIMSMAVDAPLKSYEQIRRG